MGLCILGLPLLRSIRSGVSNKYSIVLPQLFVYEELQNMLKLKSPAIKKGLSNCVIISNKSCWVNGELSGRYKLRVQICLCSLADILMAAMCVFKLIFSHSMLSFINIATPSLALPGF